MNPHELSRYARAVIGIGAEPRDEAARAAVYDALCAAGGPAARLWIARCAIQDGTITAAEGRAALAYPLHPRSPP